MIGALLLKAKQKKYITVTRGGKTFKQLRTVGSDKGFKHHASLNKNFKIKGKVMSRKEHIDSMIKEGAKYKNKKVYDREGHEKAEAMSGKLGKFVPIGNPSHPDTKKYMELKSKLKNPRENFTKESHTLEHKGEVRDLTHHEAKYIQAVHGKGKK